MDREEKVDKASRMDRLLRVIQEIRNDPHQDLKHLLNRLGISRSQFYKDRTTLAERGFVFEYSKQGFRIIEDRLAPISHLTLSESMLIMFALRNLCSSGDGHLVAKAVEVGRKMAGGLDEPFRTQVLESFDRVVWKEGFGCKATVVQTLESAISEGRRVEILYSSVNSGDTKWRTVDPRHLYFLQRALYLYAGVPMDKPKFKAFRVSRIKEVRPTGLRFTQMGDDGGFYQQVNNAFIAFIGPEAHEVTVRFTGQAAKYIQEGLWHHSQEIIKLNDHEILFKVKVAEPREVIWWAAQFGEEAEIVRR